MLSDLKLVKETENIWFIQMTKDGWLLGQCKFASIYTDKGGPFCINDTTKLCYDYVWTKHVLCMSTELILVQPVFQKWRITNKLLRATTTEIPLPKTTKVYTNHHIQNFPIYGIAIFSVFSLVTGHNKGEWYSAKLWSKISRQGCFRT